MSMNIKQKFGGRNKSRHLKWRSKFMAFGCISIALKISKSAELMLLGVKIERYDWSISEGFGLI